MPTKKTGPICEKRGCNASATRTVHEDDGTAHPLCDKHEVQGSEG